MRVLIISNVLELPSIHERREAYQIEEEGEIGKRSVSEKKREDRIVNKRRGCGEMPSILERMISPIQQRDAS
jgi:hypothetical protein